jgi:hypothetical protein
MKTAINARQKNRSNEMEEIERVAYREICTKVRSFESFLKWQKTWLDLNVLDFNFLCEIFEQSVWSFDK